MTRRKNSVCIKLGKRLKQLRIKNTMTQKALSKAIGVEEPIISSIENGKRFPSIDVAKGYKKQFGVPLEYILGLSNAEKLENQTVSCSLGLSDQAIIRLKSMQQNVANNYMDIINCIFDSGLDAKLWKCLYYYFFRDLEVTHSDLAEIRGGLADVSFSLGDKKDCLKYQIPINEADSINELALRFTLSEIKNKLKKEGYRARKITDKEDEEADYTLLPPERKPDKISELGSIINTLSPNKKS